MSDEEKCYLYSQGKIPLGLEDKLDIRKLGQRAGEKGDLKAIEYYIEKGSLYRDILKGAIKGNKFNIIDKFINDVGNFSQLIKYSGGIKTYFYLLDNLEKTDFEFDEKEIKKEFIIKFSGISSVKEYKESIKKLDINGRYANSRLKKAIERNNIGVIEYLIKEEKIEKISSTLLEITILFSPDTFYLVYGKYVEIQKNSNGNGNNYKNLDFDNLLKTSAFVTSIYDEYFEDWNQKLSKGTMKTVHEIRNLIKIENNEIYSGELSEVTEIAMNAEIPRAIDYIKKHNTFPYEFYILVKYGNRKIIKEILDLRDKVHINYFFLLYYLIIGYNTKKSKYIKMILESKYQYFLINQLETNLLGRINSYTFKYLKKISREQPDCIIVKKIY